MATNDIAFLDVIGDPFLVDGDVAFEEMKTLVVRQVFDAIGKHVHAVHVPIRGFQDARGEMVADEAVDADDEDVFHAISATMRTV
jgi:hypothetical protein